MLIQIGSPPPEGSKKEVLKLRSVKTIVIPAARTGKESRRSTAVIIIDQTTTVYNSCAYRGHAYLSQ